MKKLDKVQAILVGVQKLSDHYTQGDGSNILFHTWTIEDFGMYESRKEILNIVYISKSELNLFKLVYH